MLVAFVTVLVAVSSPEYGCIFVMLLVVLIYYVPLPRQLNDNSLCIYFINTLDS